MSLGTPNTVETLQTSLQAKAKTEPAYRFYSLWDKVCREDVLAGSLPTLPRECGSAGVDGETFEQIEAQGIERWLETLRKELMAGTYTRPAPSASMDTEEQRRPATARHPDDPRPCGRRWRWCW